MGVSNIEWTDFTFNPWIGCAKVSPGCKNCYAETDMDNRRKRVKWGINGTRSVTSYMYWRKALSWDRDAKIAGERRRVFCASLADVFEDFKGRVINSKQEELFWPQYNSYDEFESRNDLLEGTVFESLKGNLSFDQVDCDNIPTFSHFSKKYVDQIYDHDYGDERIIENSQHKKSFFEPLTVDIIRIWLFKLIEVTPNLDWLLLTKRPENIMQMVPDNWKKEFPANVWIGTSVENMEEARNRIPHLMKIPSYTRFLSCEPLLEQVNVLHRVLRINDNGLWLNNKRKMDLMQKEYPVLIPGSKVPTQPFDWLIVGGESGRGKRTFNPDWARILRDECKEAGIAFFMKQMDKVQPIPEDLMIREFPK